VRPRTDGLSFKNVSASTCLGHPLLSSLMTRGVRGRCTLAAA